MEMVAGMILFACAGLEIGDADGGDGGGGGD
jgi:hypothetical protein